MKKVLFMATVDSHILQFHLPYLKLFKDNGYEVHVATNGNEKIPYCDKKHKVSVERSPFKFNNIKAIKELKKIIEEEKFDIIHCHTPMGATVTRLAAKKSRREGTRIIYTAHGFHFYKGAPLIYWILYYPVEWYLAKYTDTLITINSEDYERAKRRFSKRCRDIQYVPGVGVDPEKFNFEMSKEEKNILRKSLGLKEDDYVLIQVGELNKNKNQIMTIKAMKELVKKDQNIKLLLVGKGNLEEYYLKKIKEYNLEKNIILTGYRKDIPQLLKISDLAISTSKREGLPLNLIEAMYSKIPILATDCRGNRDLIGDKKSIKINNKKLLISKILEKKCEKQVNTNQNIQKYFFQPIRENMEKIYFRKKRVLHVLASNKYSGAENVVCTIIENMREDFDMVYCSPNGEINKTLREKNIKFIPLKKMSIAEIKKAINEFNPDIIHAHDYKASCLVSLLKNNHKIISHIHQNSTKMRKRSTESILYRYCSKNIDKIIYVSDFALNEYYYNDSVKGKSMVLYNVVDGNAIKKKSNEFTIKENYDLIFLGRLDYPKNPERLIEIINKLKQNKEDIKLAIVGDGDKRNVIEEMIKRYELEKNIDVLGYKKNPYPYLKKSKILIMTSVYEGTPIAALEAMFFGIPIVSTPVDGLKKIVVNQYTGVLSNKNEELEKSIITLLNDEILYKKMSVNVVRHFKGYNNLKKYLKIIAKEYNKKGD